MRFFHTFPRYLAPYWWLRKWNLNKSCLCPKIRSMIYFAHEYNGQTHRRTIRQNKIVVALTYSTHAVASRGKNHHSRLRQSEHFLAYAKVKLRRYQKSWQLKEQLDICLVNGGKMRDSNCALYGMDRQTTCATYAKSFIICAFGTLAAHLRLRSASHFCLGNNKLDHFRRFSRN